MNSAWVDGNEDVDGEMAQAADIAVEINQMLIERDPTMAVAIVALASALTMAMEVSGLPVDGVRKAVTETCCGKLN